MNLNIPKSPIIVKNKDFQTIIIRVMFPFLEEEDILVKSVMLPSLLMYMNNKYPTEEDFQKNRKKNYILNVNCNKVIIGTTACLCFNLIIPDIKALGFDNLEKQFEFFSEVIYNPKIIDGGFDKNEVFREIKNLNLNIDNAMKNLGPYQAIRGMELVDDIGVFSRTIENHREQLNDITPENMYDLYLNIINSHHPAIFVFGDVEDKKINNLINKYLYKNISSNYSIEKRFNYFLKPRNKEYNFVQEKKDFKDSSVSFYYKIKDMCEEDFSKVSLVRLLLTSLSSRLLNKKLRDENDLVYSSKAIAYLRYGVFEVTAYINKKNKDIVIDKIKEVMDDLKNPDNIREYLENIKERKRVSIIRALDDKFSLLGDVVAETLEIDKNMYDSYDEILSITAEDISEFLNRFVLDTIYFIEEESHE